MDKKRVLIADDHPLFRHGVRALLEAPPDLTVCGEATNGDEAVTQAGTLRPDVMLIDIHMPGLNGIEATRRILNDHPGLYILILTMFEDDASVFTAMRTGARGYILKDAQKEDLLLDPVLSKAPVIGPYSGTISVTLVVILTTYFSLVLGELVPKQIGLNNPERVASLIAGPMATVSRITSPLVKLLSLSTTLILKTLRIGKREEAKVTEEEVRMLIVQGTRAGVFEPIEEEVVDQVFRMSDQSVSALITPRPEIVWLDLDLETFCLHSAILR